MNEKTMLYEEQLTALGALVADWAVKKDKNVKGQFTSGDYVTYHLSQIFTPAGWSFTILQGPTVVTLSETSAYVRLVGRLSVRFADGSKAHQDDIGIWPLTATGARNGGTLETTAAERYETVEKAARTDCLKNAARNLGLCFGPTTDLELLAHIKRQAFEAIASPPRSAAQHTAELFGEDKLPPEPPKEASGKTSSTTGMDRLLEEVNKALAEKGLEKYDSLAAMKTALKAIGHKSYHPDSHNSMRLQLIGHREPNAKKKDR